MRDRRPVCLTVSPWMWKLPNGPASAITIGTLQIPGPASLGNTLCKTQTMSCQDRQTLPRLQCQVPFYIYKENLNPKRLHTIPFPNSKLRCVSVYPKALFRPENRLTPLCPFCPPGFLVVLHQLHHKHASPGPNEAEYGALLSLMNSLSS